MAGSLFGMQQNQGALKPGGGRLGVVNSVRAATRLGLLRSGHASLFVHSPFPFS